MLTEERAFKEYVEGLGEIAKNIEGPLQKIIEDSAKQMDICRLKIIPYSGIETKFFASSTDISAELKKSYPIEPEIDHEYTPESNKFSSMLKWTHNPQIKFSMKSAGGVIAAVVLCIILTGIILKKFSP